MLNERIDREKLLSQTPEEDRELCAQFREFLIRHMAETGGHLASNLGVVELTLALHKVYDTEKDRLLFDVGHQSYVHKLLTGRMERFSTLRTYGGLSGFPKPMESIHDPFVAGHASDSVSVALGMARARSLKKQDYQVAVVIGDGALTGGLAYEGLNDAGESGEPLVVVLNDNGMSIRQNVGAMSRHLAMLRLKPGYFGLKKRYRKITDRIPGGKWIYHQLHQLKDFFRRKLIGVTVFEEMGFQYLGPVDGHDVSRLTFLLNEARQMGVPVLLHVITKKGRGFEPAETTPSAYHGVGRFDPETGICAGGGKVTFSSTAGATLCELALQDNRICAITAAMEDGTGLTSFEKQFPNRFFDVGIAEGHAVCMAAGLAKQGMLPVFAVYSTFLQRSFDMLIHDVSLLKLHVVFAVDRAGLVGEDGETHHGVFDVGYLRLIPGMQILCPASQQELKRLLKTAVLEMEGPVAIRYPKGGDGEYAQSIAELPLVTGEDLTVVTYGTTVNDVLAAMRMLSDASAEIIKLEQIWPLDCSEILTSVRKTGRLLVVEEAAASGCIGSEILSCLTQHGIAAQTAMINLGEGIVPHGDQGSLRALTGLDVPGIYQTAKELVHRET